MGSGGRRCARDRGAFSAHARGWPDAGFPFVNGMQNAIMTPFKSLVWRPLLFPF